MGKLLGKILGVVGFLLTWGIVPAIAIFVLLYIIF